VANSGSSTANNATTVANQIVQAAQHDPTIVGVMGWPFSSHALKAVDILKQGGIPMVSQTASTDLLTGRSNFFFRVAPSNKAQAIAGAKYAEQTLHAKTVVLFFDSHDPYSGDLAQGFKAQFTSDTNQIVDEEQYTVGNQASVAQALQNMQSKQIVPDLIYFSGHASDASTLLTNLPTTGPYAKTPVMGGDGLYELGGYPNSARAGFSRLHFTAFAYPDEWDVLGLSAQKPRFFVDYPNYFDPNRQHKGSPYGYTRADNDTILSYDAMLAMLNGASIALSGGKTSFTPGDLQQALTKINGAKSFQGVSGQIAFGPDGNPVDKAFVILHVSPEGFIQMEPTVLGTFLKKS
jgi:ABC-type branched-subunit amino acid transport system substrate-binding protein